ncbi:hypothetical protein ATO6_20665 [Oceanicola sp. 22II-s10i]|uniref:LysR family transcriptional regulator n=1 Tax=Oceanicola sp. 22II-s10i TaxID=1317116 RepID=UPI000B623CB2|nr:LysR substrate-binding domain-containing protein [Oceanicola sp. 22II-s10i]OWU83042.1 hypothetical protein ATO6_20665 [Oceanicola sp. 22II-s10i]
MDLRQLRTFVQVAEYGSLSRAADTLHIAQPALSRQIRMLEEELQVALFTRHGRGMTLTDAGALLHERAIGILNQVDITRAEVTSRDGAVTGRVAFGVPPTVGDILGARLVRRFTRRYPDVTMRIVPAFSGYLLNWLHSGHLDAAVMYDPGRPVNLVTEPLLSEDLFLVAHADDPLSFREIPFRELAKLRLVLPGPSHGLRQLIEVEAGRLGIRLNIQVEADALQTLRDLVRHRVGYAILPRASVHEYVLAGELRTHPVVAPTLSRRLVIATPLGVSMSNATRSFLDELKLEVGEMFRNQEWVGEFLAG